MTQYPEQPPTEPDNFDQSKHYQPSYNQPPSYPGAPNAYGNNPYGQPQPLGQPQQYAATPPYGQQPHPYGQPATDPGQVMAIIALVLPFVGFGLVGLILGIIAKVKSKQAGFKNTLALIAIIVSALSIVFTVVAVILIVIIANATVENVDTVTQIFDRCMSEGTSTVTIGDQVFSCSSYS